MELLSVLATLQPYLLAFVRTHIPGQTLTRSRPDVSRLLKVMIEDWDRCFRTHLPSAARSYIHELRDIRNRWAHEDEFSDVEVARALDTMRQLARAMGAPFDEGRLKERGSRPVRSAKPSGRWSEQRKVMRELFERWRSDPDRVIQEYAEAERSGRAKRKSNKSGLSAEQYARALFADGMKKGWLTD